MANEPHVGVQGLAPTVIIAPVVEAPTDTRVEPAPKVWKLEGFAPEVIIAPVVKDDG